MRKLLFTVQAVCLVISGCAFNDMRREFSGITAEDVRTAQDRQVRTVNIPAAGALEAVVKAIGRMNASVHSKDAGKGFILAYGFDKTFLSSINTTEVGIIVKEAGGQVELDVFSCNKALEKFVADELVKKLTAPAE